MADCRSAVTCCGVTDDSIFFQDKSVWDADGLTRSRPEPRHLSYSRENKFLVLDSAGQLEVKNLTRKELDSPESKFNILLYKDSSTAAARPGRPVVLYAFSSLRKMVVCCRNYQIHTEEMEPPDSMVEARHRALFYMVSRTGSRSYMFESMVHPGWFLAFQHEGGLLKLVLLQRDEQVDDRCDIRLG